MSRSPAFRACSSPSPSRPSPSPSREDSPAQARLLRARGDLVRTTRSFDANLSEPGARAKPVAVHRPLTRLGFEVMQGAEAADLSVACIDTGLAQVTPVSQWNTVEARKAGFGVEPLPIKPGDRICAVNGVEDDDGMIDELLAAASMMDPKPVSLRIERPNSAVLERSPPCRRAPPEALSAERPPALPMSKVATACRGRRRSDMDFAYNHTQPMQANFSSSDVRPDVRPPRLPSPWIPAVPKSSKSKRSGSRDEEASTRSPSLSASTSRSSSFIEVDEQKAGFTGSVNPILPAATASWGAMRRSSRACRK